MDIDMSTTWSRYLETYKHIGSATTRLFVNDYKFSSLD